MQVADDFAQSQLLLFQQLFPINLLVILMKMLMVSLFEALLADIKVRAFFAMIAFIFDGMCSTYVTLVFVEDIFVFVGLSDFGLCWSQNLSMD